MQLILYIIHSSADKPIRYRTGLKNPYYNADFQQQKTQTVTVLIYSEEVKKRREPATWIQ